MKLIRNCFFLAFLLVVVFKTESRPVGPEAAYDPAMDGVQKRVSWNSRHVLREADKLTIDNSTEIHVKRVGWNSK